MVAPGGRPWSASGPSTPSLRLLGLRLDQVETALSYWAENRGEIDAWLERHHRLQEEELAAWERRQALATA